MTPDLTDSCVTCTPVVHLLSPPHTYIHIYSFFNSSGSEGTGSLACLQCSVTALKSFLANEADHFQGNLLNEVALETPNYTTLTSSYWLSLGSENRIKQLLEMAILFLFFCLFCASHHVQKGVFDSDNVSVIFYCVWERDDSSFWC